MFSHSGSVILCLDYCIKYGVAVDSVEADSNHFVAGHTSILLSKVHHAFIHQGVAHILMERIRGETVKQRWWALSDAYKTAMFSQSRAYDRRTVLCVVPNQGRLRPQ